MMEFIRWRDTVLRQVRFKPDRKAIREELNGHYEDKVADLERLGYDRKLAESRALEAMGDAVEIGKAFDKVHKPWLGWLWKVTTWVAVILVLVTVWNVWNGGYLEIQNSLGLMPDAVDYQPDGQSFLFADTDSIKRVYWKPLSNSIERNGHTISVPYMAIFKHEYDDGDFGYYLEVVIEEKDPYFWEKGPNLSGLRGVGNDGALYWNSSGQDRGREGTMFPLLSEHNLFGTIYKGVFELEETTDQWLEITYPHGEPWTFRLDWEEADLK